MNDAFIAQADTALRTLFNVGQAARPNPAAELKSQLQPAEAKHAAGLMRVNHVGEVCAQALYAGQSLLARSPEIKAFHLEAAQEERDHLLWCASRLKELNARPSALNLLWYAGSFALGVAAGLVGDQVSLAFVRETEAQVEAHLHAHAQQLPSADVRSLAIVAAMQADEAAHGAHAADLGAQPLPIVLQVAMKASAKLMTQTAYYV